MRIPNEVREPMTGLRDLTKNMLHDLDQGGDDQDYDLVAFEADLYRLQGYVDKLSGIIRVDQGRRNNDGL
jgi:hypothetical protein